MARVCDPRNSLLVDGKLLHFEDGPSFQCPQPTEEDAKGGKGGKGAAQSKKKKKRQLNAPPVKSATQGRTTRTSTFAEAPSLSPPKDAAGLLSASQTPARASSPRTSSTLRDVEDDSGTTRTEPPRQPGGAVSQPPPKKMRSNPTPASETPSAPAKKSGPSTTEADSSSEKSSASTQASAGAALAMEAAIQRRLLEQKTALDLQHKLEMQVSSPSTPTC